MVLAGLACVDEHEAPNVPGAFPLAMQTATDGEAWCRARGKRLCTEAEWLRACQGPSGWRYPYGNEYQAHRCNDDKTWISPDWDVLASWPSDAAQAEARRLYQADPSGARTGCVSAEGVRDLTGNVAEWVVRSFPNRNNYDHVLKGCYWAKCYGGTNPNCTFVNPAHSGSFRTYEAGFRCCKDPAGIAPIGD
jgi:formylglycine-generating enzyme required for sulfatase activity